MFGTPRDRLNDLMAFEDDRGLDGPELREMLRELADMAFDNPNPVREATRLADVLRARGRSLRL